MPVKVSLLISMWKCLFSGSDSNILFWQTCWLQQTNWTRRKCSSYFRRVQSYFWSQHACESESAKQLISTDSASFSRSVIKIWFLCLQPFRRNIRFFSGSMLVVSRWSCVLWIRQLFWWWNIHYPLHLEGRDFLCNKYAGDVLLKIVYLSM